MTAADTVSTARPAWPAPPGAEARLGSARPSSGADGSARPVTEGGRYLRAAALEQAPARLAPTADTAGDEARRVWAAAFGLAVRRRFEPGAPLAAISRTVARAVEEHSAAALHPLDAEMAVRDALGERVPVGEMEPAVLAGIHLLVFASLIDELALDDDELDALIAGAEARTRPSI
jgi:hypothetical protein